MSFMFEWQEQYLTISYIYLRDTVSLRVVCFPIKHSCLYNKKRKIIASSHLGRQKVKKTEYILVIYTHTLGLKGFKGFNELNSTEIRRDNATPIKKSNFCSVEYNSYIMLIYWACVNLIPPKKKNKPGHSGLSAASAYCNTYCCTVTFLLVLLKDYFSQNLIAWSLSTFVRHIWLLCVTKKKKKKKKHFTLTDMPDSIQSESSSTQME